MLLEQAQTELRRRMEPGTEGHPGIKIQHQIIGLGLVLQPGGHNHRAWPNAHHAVVLFPGIGPILLLERTKREGADRTHLAEVPEGLFNPLPRFFGLGIEG